VTTKSDILDLVVVMHRSTDKAVFVSEDGDVSKAKWLPRSQIEIDFRRREKGVVLYDLQIPQWLAEQEGFV